MVLNCRRVLMSLIASTVSIAFQKMEFGTVSLMHPLILLLHVCYVLFSILFGRGCLKQVVTSELGIKHFLDHIGRINDAKPVWFWAMQLLNQPDLTWEWFGTTSNMICFEQKTVQKKRGERERERDYSHYDRNWIR